MAGPSHGAVVWADAGEAGRPVWRLMGPPSIVWDGEDLTGELGKKAIALIARLAVSPDGVGRDELAAQLWPPAETSAELARAKHSLRQCLVSVRRAFGAGYAQVFIEETGHLALRPGVVLTDAAKLMRAGADTPPEALAELCRGPFLAGLVSRARPFDAWIDSRRAHIANIAGPLLEAALRKADAAGDRGLSERLALAADRMGLHAAEPSAPGPGAPSRRGWPWRGIGIVAAVALGLGAAVSLSPGLHEQLDRLIGHEEQTGPARISVLPFTSLAGTPDEKVLANGITFGVTYALHAVSNLYPVTPAPVSETLDQAELVARAGQLGVRYLITGAVATDGAQVRIDVQCFDAKTRALVWTERFSQARAESFRLQDAITLRIIKGLKIEVSSAELNRIQYLQDTDSLEAWLAATRGLSHLIRVTRTDVEQARVYYQEALTRDPGYISARRGLAWTAFLAARLGWAENPAMAIGEAKNQLGVILKTRPDDGTSLSLEGAVMLMEGRYDDAVKMGEAAVAALPGSADVNAIFAHTLTYTGDPKRALGHVDKALALSELPPAFYNWTRGRALRLDGRFDESVEALEAGLSPGDPALVHLVELSASYAAAGRLAEARLTAARIRAMAPGFTATLWLSHPRVKDPEVHSKEFEYLSLAGL